MALLIREQKGIFYLQKNLNTSSKSLAQNLRYILNVQAEIAINSKGINFENKKGSKLSKENFKK